MLLRKIYRFILIIAMVADFGAKIFSFKIWYSLINMNLWTFAKQDSFNFKKKKWSIVTTLQQKLQKMRGFPTVISLDKSLKTLNIKIIKIKNPHCVTQKNQRI